ncbi:hypothetical protein KDK_13410 [Dictyobacter kobayashii]|uniref:NACHT domain-containing protein n=1 Tax=Dictyobacter kobayashii TaxID=2014872 RepID=A0A402AEM0_9CHLR|nr:hypothetical protein KDK_13410 [Dictyobacter kobayashii]
MDGLDEVADLNTRLKVVEWVQMQMHVYGKNRFVIASRPYGYRDNRLEGVTVLDAQNFNNEQIETFILNWYLSTEFRNSDIDYANLKRRASEATKDLVQRLYQSPALSKLAANPLLLTMIVTIHREDIKLPERRVELYEEICNVFLGTRYEARSIPQDLSLAQKQRILQQLAYFMMMQNQREIADEDAQEIIAPCWHL